MYARIDSLLCRVTRATRLLAAATPHGVVDERKRLAEALKSGRLTSPHWTYMRHDGTEAAAVLRAAAEELARAPRAPMREVYVARLEELAAEATMASTVGRPRFATLAATRFRAATHACELEARELANAWIALDAPPRPSDARASDAPHPQSLLSRMRVEVGRRRLPFRVVVDATLGSLAATGERTIFVAAGRAADDEDVERTVLHEIEAHALPRARAALLAPGIFAIGTARGTDDQEGLALVLEERAGFLTPRRRRELAARHLAVAWMHAGGTFVEVAMRLATDYGLAGVEAVRVAERAFRGGDGTRPGLGRERVYLESFVRVRARLAQAPDDERVLASGQVAVDAINVLRAHAGGRDA